MYHPISYPQILYTLVFILPVIGFAYAFHESSIHLEEFIDVLPSINLLISSAVKTFRVCIHIACICIIMIAYDFFNYSKKIKKLLPKSTITSLLRYYQIVNGYIAVIGYLGFVTYPDSDISAFQLGMEFIYFFGALNFLLAYDVLLHMLKKHVFFGVWIYNSLMTIIVLSFYALRVLTMVLDVEEAISLSAITEYIAFFVIALKFPICGWELQSICENVSANTKKD